MGSWIPDQAKHARRYDWRTTRGQKDAIWRDFDKRIKAHPPLNALRHEKIGSEIHFFRLMNDPNGKPFWSSCLRFVDDGWGYWTLQWRPDEGRWRSTGIEDLAAARVISAAAEFYREKSHAFQ